MRFKPVLALAVAAGVAIGRPAAAQTNTGPVAANAFITFGGLDWAWAGPCFFGTPSCLDSFVLVDGFRFATTTEWATRPDPSAFLDPSGNFAGDGGQMRCASAWFDVSPAYVHCDYGDAVSDYLSSGPGVGDFLYGSNDAFDETWVVRGDDHGHLEDVTPEPATMSLLAAGLVGLAGVSRRKRKAS